MTNLDINTKSTRWRFYCWLALLIHNAEQAARDDRLAGTTAYHDAITGDLLWLT